MYHTTFAVAATSSSGLSVSFGSGGVCSNTGAKFTMTNGSGTCTVNYDQAGDSNYSAAPQLNESVTAQPGTQNVTPIVTVSSSQNPSATKVPVFFTATLDQTAATGTVQFVVDGQNFGGPVVLANGVATSASTSTLNPGTHTVVTVYSGDTLAHVCGQRTNVRAFARPGRLADPLRAVTVMFPIAFALAGASDCRKRRSLA